MELWISRLYWVARFDCRINGAKLESLGFPCCLIYQSRKPHGNEPHSRTEVSCSCDGGGWLGADGPDPPQVTTTPSSPHQSPALGGRQPPSRCGVRGCLREKRHPTQQKRDIGRPLSRLSPLRPCLARSALKRGAQHPAPSTLSPTPPPMCGLA